MKCVLLASEAYKIFKHRKMQLYTYNKCADNFRYFFRKNVSENAVMK